jgi:hypothetical protein
MALAIRATWSAVAAAGYRSGMALTDERLGMDFDFVGKEGVEFAEILAPETAPPRFSDRQTLWNAAEKREARKDAVPARELLLALPHELDFEQRRAPGPRLRGRAPGGLGHGRRHGAAPARQGGISAQLLRPHPGHDAARRAGGLRRQGAGLADPAKGARLATAP